jgi:hypothetical protein
MSDLFDNEGKGWFEENKEQMRRFTEQQVKEIVIKENLAPHQTFQTQRILEQDRTTQMKRPTRIPRGELGLNTQATKRTNII